MGGKIPSLPDVAKWENTSFVPALRTIEKLTNGYYLISYATQKAAGERGFQKVNVAVKNADFRVRARRGYSLGD